MNDSNLGFLQFYFRGSLVITPCVPSVLRNFEDDNLTTKTAKFISLKNLYAYMVIEGL